MYIYIYIYMYVYTIDIYIHTHVYTQTHVPSTTMSSRMVFDIGRCELTTGFVARLSGPFPRARPTRSSCGQAQDPSPSLAGTPKKGEGYSEGAGEICFFYR